MKKLALIAFVGVLALTSCKKDYTCDCTIANQTTSTAYNGLSKKEAKDTKVACDNANATAAIFGGSCTWNTK